MCAPNCVSKDGRTRKLLLELGDGRLIETVLMLYPATSESRARATVCVSTQAGCAYGCTFCATGQMGFDRHLTAGEIVAQVLHFARELRAQPWKAPDGAARSTASPISSSWAWASRCTTTTTRCKALRILNMPEGLNIGARHMTISTVGAGAGHSAAGRGAAASQPRDLAARAERRDAPADDARHAQISDRGRCSTPCRQYVARTNRQVTFEYVLLAGVNDTPEHARELATLLAPLRQLCHVNLIPVNKTAAGYLVPSGEAIRAFRDTLRAGGVSNSVRAERGDDIAAACGQLSTRETAPGEDSIVALHSSAERRRPCKSCIMSPK